MPAKATAYQDQCRAALLENRAHDHDTIVAVCMQHAAPLQGRNEPIDR